MLKPTALPNSKQSKAAHRSPKHTPPGVGAHTRGSPAATTMSWATIAKLTPAAAPVAAAPVDAGAPKRTAVVDANAIISGLRLEGVAERFVTIGEVLREVRDKQSREWLATLAHAIEVIDPPKASVEAGKQGREGVHRCTLALHCVSWGAGRTGVVAAVKLAPTRVSTLHSPPQRPTYLCSASRLGSHAHSKACVHTSLWPRLSVCALPGGATRLPCAVHARCTRRRVPRRSDAVRP